jgi:hypothetical protein
MRGFQFNVAQAGDALLLLRSLPAGCTPLVFSGRTTATKFQRTVGASARFQSTYLPSSCGNARSSPLCAEPRPSTLARRAVSSL